MKHLHWSVIPSNQLKTAGKEKKKDGRGNDEGKRREKGRRGRGEGMESTRGGEERGDEGEGRKEINIT